jgi:hypothetical protein
MNLSEHRFTAAFFTVVVLLLLPVPGQPLFSLVLLLYFPGVLVTSLIKKECDMVEVLALPFLLGMSFWIVFSYFISELALLHYITVLVVSFVAAVITDTRNIKIKVVRHELVFLILCCLFIVSYSYPWSQFFEWVPPGDDMKYHMTHIENTVLDCSLPETYGALYPEINTLTYPLGYHIIMSLTSMGSPSLPSVIGPTLFILPFVCFSFYFLGRTLFSKKAGLYAAFSISFLSLFFHRLLSTSTYPNLLAITLQVCAFFLLNETLDRGNNKKMIIMTALVFAASGITHSYILLLNVLFLAFLGGFFLLKRDFSRTKSIVLITGSFLVLCIPYLVRFNIQTLSTVEMWTFTVWYAEDSIRSAADLVRTVSLLSPLLLLFGILGGVTLKKKSVLGLWALAILLIPALSALNIQYPGWYTISPNRIFFYLCAPLCIASGKFLADLEVTLERKKFLSFILVIVLISGGMHHVNLFKSFEPDPVSEVQMNPDDAFIMQWIAENTPEDAVILNTGPTVDCSSWVPILCKRRVVFPSFSGHRGDTCIEKVGAHRARTDLWIVEHTPDSDVALQVLKKYNIGYIYVPSWRKRWYLELHPERLLESPLYLPVAKKGGAYLFRVNYHGRPRTAFFVIQEYHNVTMEAGELRHISFLPSLSPDVQGQFFLSVYYTDDAYGQIDITEDTTHTGTILKYKTGEEKIMVYPLSGLRKINLFFYPEFDCTLEESYILFGLEDGIIVSDHIGLKGSGWLLPSESGVTAQEEDSSLRIYLFNVDNGELIITYRDTGYGHVDINVCDVLGVWHTALIIDREGTGEIKEVKIPVNGEYSIFVLGIYAYGEDFIVTELQYEVL